MTDEESVLQRMGIEYESPAPGCCGMAGSFGFEADKYEVSMAVGELELLPAVRRASAETLIIADGFSCREQIAQCTPREALHLAEIIQFALGGQNQAEPGASPERALVEQRQAGLDRSMKRAAAWGAGILAGSALLWSVLRRLRP
jgi:hypothetical protein